MVVAQAKEFGSVGGVEVEGKVWGGGKVSRGVLEGFKLRRSENCTESMDGAGISVQKLRGGGHGGRGGGGGGWW